MADISPIEMAKSISNLKPLTETNKDFETLKDQLIPTELQPRVDQILKGLSEEDEFAVLCKSMDTCTSLTKLDQTPIIDTEEQTADFLCSFSPGISVAGKNQKHVNRHYSCLVEVKSCQKEAFKISQKDLDRRIRFAQKFRLPLVFAVRFTKFCEHSLWVWQEAHYLAKNGRRLDPTSLSQSVGAILLDDYFLHPHPHMHIIYYYDKKANGGASHKDYGVQTSIVVLIGDQPLELPKEHAMLIGLALEMFEKEECDIKTSGSETAVLMRVKEQGRMLSDIIHFCNRCAVDEKGEPSFDARRFLSMQDGPKKPLFITRDMIEFAIAWLNHPEVTMFKMALIEPKKHEKILKKMTSG